MQFFRHNGSTSNVFRVTLRHSTTGAGLTGLTEASSGLIIGTIADNEATTTRYRAGSSEIETISTLGTFAAPTSGKCRFKEVDATNHPGLYEVQLADARFAVSNAKILRVTISGATNLITKDVTIQLTTANIADNAAPPANTTHAAGTAWNSGAITANTFDADSITAAKLAADVTTELQAGLATAAELAKVPKSDSNVTWNATAAAQLQSEAADALNAYDPPTKAELDSAVAPLATAASLATVAGYLDTEVAAILEDTGTTLPAQIAALNNLSQADIRTAVGLATANLDTQIDAIPTAAENATAVVAQGSLGADVDAIKAKTDNLPASPAATGAEMALTAAAIDAILDEVVEGSTTFRQMLRGFAAALMGKANGLETTSVNYRDIGDTKNRITATVDADGNRTAVTMDLT